MLKEYSKSNKNTIKQGVLLWKCVYSVLFNNMGKNDPNIIIMKHEDICDKPIKNFSYLYKKLDIKITDNIKKAIKNHTSTKNPVKVKNNKAHHDLKRNSKKIKDYWKKLVNKEEKNYILENIQNHPIFKKYYQN
ncbi:MAG: hypothetical protein FXF54_03300 [Kosmotoga sp.]|nr:MAG: hypothetical protein FXF54_03300 [Kosmotoga sp.]